MAADPRGSERLAGKRKVEDQNAGDAASGSSGEGSAGAPAALTGQSAGAPAIVPIALDAGASAPGQSASQALAGELAHARKKAREAGAPAHGGTGSRGLGSSQPNAGVPASVAQEAQVAAGAPAPQGSNAGAPASNPDPAEMDISTRSAKRQLEEDSTMDDLAAFFELEVDSVEDQRFLAFVAGGDDLSTGSSSGSKQVDCAEVFCPPRLTERAGLHGVNPGIAMDLRTGWDLNDPRHVEAAWRYIKLVKPLVLLGSPECAPFSVLRGLNQHKPGYAEKLREGMQHLKLCCELYTYQVRCGRFFVHEHPWSASSWGVSLMQDVLKLPGVQTAFVDQCMFGQTVTKHGVTGPARKSSGFASNSHHIVEELSRKCDKSHQHIPLIGGVARQTAAYPSGLVDAILRGLKKEMADMGRIQAMDGGGPTVEEEPCEQWPEYWDEITGQALDSRLVAEAREAEVDYMRRLKVYEESSMEQCLADGCQPIPMRWLDVNKGDSDNPQIRSRAVLQETKRRSDLGPEDVAATFAATPPLEGLRVLMSMCMTGQKGVAQKDRRVLGFYDVSRAHFHSPARRKIYVKTLPEDTHVKSGIALMLKAMYGAKDAGACWDGFADQVMRSLGYKPGGFCACVYSNAAQQSTCWRHGDDFVLLATREEHKRFMAEANKQMILKSVGILGPYAKDGEVQEIRCLNRIIRLVQPAFQGYDESYLEWEADPRHLQILMTNLQVKPDSKALGQPGCKMEANADTTPLESKDVAAYRSNCMRLAYLAQDRADIQYCSKELARGMQQPTRWDLAQLKRAVRYLKGAPRLVQRFRQQELQQQLCVYTDSDFAGCPKTRRSTSCNMVFWGQHLIRSASTTQAVVALSSGEAEFYSAVKGASVGLGCASLFADMGFVLTMPIKLLVDSTACLGVAGRRGAGRIRHIQTPTLWLQRYVSDGHIVLAKVDGKDNPADLGTKPVPAALIEKILMQCGLHVSQGRSKLALKAAV